MTSLPSLLSFDFPLPPRHSSRFLVSYVTLPNFLPLLRSHTALRLPLAFLLTIPHPFPPQSSSSPLPLLPSHSLLPVMLSLSCLALPSYPSDLSSPCAITLPFLALTPPQPFPSPARGNISPWRGRTVSRYLSIIANQVLSGSVGPYCPSSPFSSSFPLRVLLPSRRLSFPPLSFPPHNRQ